MHKSLSCFAALVIAGVVGSSVGLAYADPSSDTTVPVPEPPPAVVIDAPPAAPATVPAPAPAQLPAVPVPAPVAPAAPVAPVAPPEAPPVPASPPAAPAAPAAPETVAPATPANPAASAPVKVDPPKVDTPAPAQTSDPTPTTTVAPTATSSAPDTTVSRAPSSESSEAPAPPTVTGEPGQGSGSHGSSVTTTQSAGESPAPSGPSAPNSESSETSDGSSEESATSDKGKPGQETVVPGSPTKGTSATEEPKVTTVDAPAPAKPLPVTEEMLAQPPIEATVQNLNAIDSSSDHGPRPGGPVKLPEDKGNPPPTTNVNIIGDNNNVTIVNVVGSPGAKVDVNQDNDEHYVVLRRLDKPGHDIRIPAPPNRPISLPRNWCGGEAGVWAYAGAGIGPSGPWAAASAGVFASSGGCGFVQSPPPQRPLTVCPPRGWHGDLNVIQNYTVINNTTVFANNTWIKGYQDQRVINGVSQPVFVGEQFSTNPVFQAPTQTPPKWLGFQGYGPLGENPTGDGSTQVIATDNRVRNALWGVSAAGVLVLAAIIVGAVVRRRHEG